MYAFKKLEENKEAIIFARVSSKEQEQEGQSLEAQINSIREYCEKRGLTVIREFKIIESSTKADRPEFDKMIDFVNNRKGKVNLVCYAVDRLNRDLKSAGTIMDLATKNKIVCHCLRDNLILDADSDDFSYLINSVMAYRETKVLSKRVRHVFDQKREEGTILGPAPIGYLNLPRSNNQKRAVVELDPERAYIIKQIFEDYSSGLYSMEDIRREATEKGLRTLRGKKKLGKSQIELILSNPFYCGFMKSKENIYQHIYEKLISKELFDKCQDVRFNRKNKRYKRTMFPFTYRGLLTCSYCGCSYSPDKKKGKYVYMYPRLKKDCLKCHNIREEVISEQLEKIIKQVYIPEEILEKVKACLEETLNEQYGAKIKELSILKSKHQKLDERKSKALELFLDNSITKNEYDPLVQSIKEEKFLIEERINKLNEVDDSFKSKVISVFELVNKSYELFKSSESEDKRKIINLLFQSLQMDGKKVLFSLQKPLDEWIELKGRPIWLPNQCTTRTFISKEAYDIQPKFVVDKMTGEHTEHSLHTAGIIVKFHKAVAMAA